jgi:hypothetical protein
MTLSLALTLNAIADVALVGGLTWFMSRPGKLTPHVTAGPRLVVLQGESENADQDVRLAA